MAALKTLILWLTFACLFLTVGALVARAFVTTVEDSAFDGQRTRPTVSFEHDEHNEAAGIESCNTCHHFYENGEKLDDRDSIGMECSDCHYEAQDDKLEMIQVYHRQCKSCHLEEKTGPVQCGQCHTKTPENSK